MSTRRKGRTQSIPQSAKQPDLTSEALRLVRAGRDADLELRILGSTAVAAKCRSAEELLRRHGTSPKDIDLAALGHHRRRIRDFLYRQGLKYPDNGVITPYMDRDVFIAKRPGYEVRVEVFFDQLRFVHRINFAGDFARSFPTLPLETLIMSKLQMRRRSFFDWVHLAALLIESAAEEDQGRSFNGGRITGQAEGDYRCWRDFQGALATVASQKICEELRLTGAEVAALTKGAGLVSAALAAARHGPRWIIGRIKAFVGIEPPEPEVAEYWEAG